MPERDLHLEVTTDADSSGLAEAARDTGKLTDQVKGLGVQMDTTRTQAEKMRAEIARTQTKIRDLSAEFARTGDKSLFGDLRNQRSFLANLEKIRKELEQVDKVAASISIGGAAAGGGGGGEATTLAGAGRSLAGLGNLGIPLAVGIGMQLVPALSSMIAGAVVGGVGVGGVIGGAVLAARDPNVKGAWRSLGQEISKDLGDISKPMIMPIQQAAGVLRDEWKKTAPILADIFDNLSEGVDPLARGLGGMGREMATGFRDSGEESLAILRDMEKQLPETGKAFADFFSLISDPRADARGGMNDLFTLLQVGARTAGFGIGAAGAAWRDIKNNPMLALGPGPAVLMGAHTIDQATNLRTSVKSGLDEKTLAVKQFAEELEHARNNVEALNLSVDDLFGARMGADEARLAMQRTIIDLREMLGEGGGVKAGTEAGIGKRQAILDAIQDAIRMRDAMRENGASAETANRAYMEQIRLIESLGIKAGITRAEMEKLAGKYEISIFASVAGTVPRGIRFTDTYALEGEFRNLPRRAMGGPVLAGRAYMVGEHGPEPFVPSTNGTILPNGSGMPARVEWVGGPTDELGAAAFLYFQKRIRITYGGNVQKALGQR